MCKVENTYPYNLHKLPGWFKTTAVHPERHIKVYPAGDIEKLQCAKCKNWYRSNSMINHQRWHRSLQILARSKRQRLAKEANLSKKGQEAALTGSKIGV